MTNWFVVTRMHRDDLKAVEEDKELGLSHKMIDKIPDEVMKHLCKQVSEAMCENGLYWGIIEDWLADKDNQDKYRLISVEKRL